MSLSLAQTLLAWAYACFRVGEFSKTVDIVLETLLVAQSLVEREAELSEAWKLIGDACYIGSLVCVDGINELAVNATQVLEIHVSGRDGPLDGALPVDDPGDLVKTLLKANIAAMERTVELTNGDRLAHSAAYFNLGLARFHSSTAQDLETNTEWIRPILECFKKAIHMEPGNFGYWNALGVATARHFPFIAEKAFSRCLQINERVSNSPKFSHS